MLGHESDPPLRHPFDRVPGIKLVRIRFVRFAAVGITNTLLTFAAFVLLTRVGLAPGPASGLAFGLGAANGYVLNRAWTFRDRGGAATVVRYVSVQALGAAFSAAGVALASSDFALPKLDAEALVVPFVTVLTYTLARTLVFRAGPS